MKNIYPNWFITKIQHYELKWHNSGITKLPHLFLFFFFPFTCFSKLLSLWLITEDEEISSKASSQMIEGERLGPSNKQGKIQMKNCCIWDGIKQSKWEGPPVPLQILRKCGKEFTVDETWESKGVFYHCFLINPYYLWLVIHELSKHLPAVIYKPPLLSWTLQAVK